MCGFLKKEDLIRLYVNKRLTCRKVANILKCGHSTVTKYLQRYKIPTRTNSDYRYFGSQARHWQGGKTKHQRGYILVYAPWHPHCDSHGYVFEHRLVKEKQLGRYLTGLEVVHHNNKKLDDNRPENLRLFESQSAHISMHFKKAVMLMVALTALALWILDYFNGTTNGLILACGFYGHGFIYEKVVCKCTNIEPIPCFSKDIQIKASKVSYEEEKERHILYDFAHNSHHDIAEFHPEIHSRRDDRIGFNPYNLEPLSQDAIICPEDEMKISQRLSGIFVSRWQIVQWIKNNYGKYDDESEWRRGFPYMLTLAERLRICPYHTNVMRDYSMRLASPGIGLDSFLRAFAEYPNEFWAKKTNEQKELPEYTEMIL